MARKMTQLPLALAALALSLALGGAAPAFAAERVVLTP